MPLNPKRRKFVAEYLKDQNASAAAVRAGYSAKNADVTGSTLYNTPQIKKAIESKLQKAEEKAEINLGYFLNSLHEVLERCKQATPVLEFNRETRKLEPTGEWQFDSAGANAALRMIGQYLGLLSEKHVHELGKLTLEQLILHSQEAE